MRLDHALRAAELENLRAQLQPHFLFNTLQSISTLLHRDPIAADRMLADLAGLLRLSLQHSAAQEVPLRDELAFLERYLDIMRTRLGDHVVITVEPETEVLDAMVPSLVLQPLVENAIRHGLAGRSEQGRVGVRATRRNGALHLEVWDDGPGLSALSAGERNGIGLTNTRERLARLYGPKSSIETVAMPGRGHTVRVSVPYRTTP
jgi:sensor histidine kinase YesM